MAFYYLILGNSNFYSNRFALPLIGTMALVISKTLFLDLDGWLARFPRLRRGVAGAGFAAVVVFSAVAVNGNLKTFNLLSTAGQWERAENYRKSHIPDRFRAASEAFTPHRATDYGIWDLTRLPLDLFRGEKGVDFAVTGLLSDYILRSTRNEAVKNELRARLAEYRPFYRAAKTRFGPWDGDVLFWYRAARELRKSPPTPEPPPLPRSYLPSASEGTAFLPLQLYEKNPLFGKTEKGIYRQTIYSTRPVGKIRFVFFFPEGPTDLVLTLNGRRQAIRNVRNSKIVLFEISGFADRKMHLDHVYLMEIVEATKDIPCFFMFTPEYGDPAAARSPRFSSPWTAADEIPELFSDLPIPPWVSFFFRRTGVDLALLTFVNRTELFRNEDETTADVDSGWFPLENGIYTILVDLERLVSGGSTGREARLKWESVSASGGETEETRPLDFSGKGNRQTFQMTVCEPLAFFRISAERLRANNLLLRELAVQPDYREWIRNGKTPFVSPGEAK